MQRPQQFIQIPKKQRSSIRYMVEKTFGLLKLHYDLGKARHFGLECNKTRAR
jgi:IS5 family transposase